MLKNKTALFRGFLVLAIATLWPALPASADDAEALVEQASQDALKQTQQLLQSPDLRAPAIGASFEAKQADSKVRALAGQGADSEAVYKLSSDIFGNLVRKTEGDPEKVQQLLLDANKDPESLSKHMSEQDRQKLREITNGMSQPRP